MCIQNNDISNKINKYQLMYRVIKKTLKNKVRKKTSMKFYKFMAFPALLHVNEIWVTGRRDVQHIQAAEIHLSRPSKGRNLQDRDSKSIHRDLNIHSIVNMFYNYRIERGDT